ncbi:MAG: DUF5777 family beta-barrel protein [Bacteroidetes bacterium]|nr:DUF5777 family beta-barrel protein [Bacteroidota bacterium]
MNLKIYNINKWLVRPVYFTLCLLLNGAILAQDSTMVTQEVAAPTPKVKPVKNTFEGIWIIDNQTVMVSAKGTFEMDILHRFGTIKNKYEDLWGFWAPSNIRLGFSYVPINNLLVGFSLTKAFSTWDVYGKYAIISQTKGKYPVSATYFGDIAIDSRKKDNFEHFADRVMYFNQLIIARKITEKLSVQLAPSQTHINVTNGYYTDDSEPINDHILKSKLNHNHIALGVSARYKLKESVAIIINYDQPLTKHPYYYTDPSTKKVEDSNPKPNLSFGIDLTTSNHSFQIFMGNYSALSPQRNNLFNKNDFKDLGQFLIGFNITRLANF